MITQLILDTAERVPEKIAISNNGEDFTYHWFAARIRAATRYFLGHRIHGGGVAALATNHLLTFWVWSLALRRLGLTIVSVSSADELQSLTVSDLRFVITVRGHEWLMLADTCRERGLALHEVDMSKEEDVLSDEAPLHEPGGQILKTSGTTGSLKKILIEPQSEDMYADERAGLLGLTENTVCNVFRLAPWTGLGYKVPVNVWAKGGRIIINQLDDIHSVLHTEGPTHAVLTPSILAEILSSPEGSFPRHEEMLLCVTGGPITHVQLADARRRITPLLFNMLATTEIGIFGFTPFDRPVDHRWHRMLPGSTIQIVDDDHVPVVAGTIGRLRVANPTEARYFEEAEANELFFRDGFFYPGDLAEAHEDGRIALHGRTTDVINIGGSKISPAPLEALLSAEFDGRQVCIISRQDSNGEETLFCVVEGNAPVDELRVASLFHRELGIDAPNLSYVDKMPRTESGKVIRQALSDVRYAITAR